MAKINKTFNPVHVLPDKLFPYDPGFRTRDFLDLKGSFLSTYAVGDLSTARLIDDECARSNVNQKWILTRLQCEQGLIGMRNKPEYQWKMDYCLGFGVLDGKYAKVLEKYKGFGTQIKSCAKRSRELFDEFKKGMSLDIDGDSKGENRTRIAPANSFSWMLYRYTPHVEGAELTMAVWGGYWPEDFA